MKGNNMNETARSAADLTALLCTKKSCTVDLDIDSDALAYALASASTYNEGWVFQVESDMDILYVEVVEPEPDPWDDLEMELLWDADEATKRGGLSSRERQ